VETLSYLVAVEVGGPAITAHGLLDLKQEIPIQIQSSAHTVVAVESKALGVRVRVSVRASVKVMNLG
jgi:hypothetical protein